MLLVSLSSSSEIGSVGEKMLLSGGGDGVVKLWAIDRETSRIDEVRSLSGGDSGVLSMVVQDSLLYCGLTDGEICIWDLDTCQLIRSVKSHCDDVLTMSIKGNFMFSGSASGYMRVCFFDAPHEFSMANDIGHRNGTRDLNVSLGGSHTPD